jgi:hypothetical protein
MVGIALNPLLWVHGDPLHQPTGAAPSAEQLLDFLRGPFATTSLDELRGRYEEISKTDRPLFAFPQHPRLFNGIVTPLHNAKAAYIIGHFLSCIALAGVICEMVAIFRFEIASIQCGGKTLDESRQKLLWGRSFEMLGQKERIGALDALGLLDHSTIKAMADVQGIRRKYMHLLTNEKDSEKVDAKRAYSLAVEVCAAVVGAKLQDGSFAIHFHPDLTRWLKERGLLKPREENSERGPGEGGA